MQRDEILKVLKEFKSINGDRYKIVRLGLFGSGARDMFREQSDIDVVVVLKEPDAMSLVGIKQDLEEVFMRHVDIVRYRDKMNPFLRKKIEKEAIYV